MSLKLTLDTTHKPLTVLKGPSAGQRGTVAPTGTNNRNRNEGMDHAEYSEQKKFAYRYQGVSTTPIIPTLTK